jgi:hypothetical protein
MAVRWIRRSAAGQKHHHSHQKYATLEMCCRVFKRNRNSASNPFVQTAYILLQSARKRLTADHNIMCLLLDRTTLRSKQQAKTSKHLDMEKIVRAEKTNRTQKDKLDVSRRLSKLLPGKNCRNRKDNDFPSNLRRIFRAFGANCRVEKEVSPLFSAVEKGWT